MIHENSIASYEDVKSELNGRHELIFSAYQKQESAELTDREIKDKLNLIDMNQVRPRVTELIKSGWVLEVGDKKCPITHKTVRVTTINPDKVTYDGE